MSLRYMNQLEDIVASSKKRQNKYLSQLSEESEKLNQMHSQFDADEKKALNGYIVNQTLIDDMEERAQNPLQMSDHRISAAATATSSLKNYHAELRNNTSSDGCSSERIEFEGFDGLQLVLASVAVQVESDLIQRNHI